MDIRIETTAEPQPDEIAFIGERLAAFNESDVGPSEKTPLAVFVRDENGAIMAGVTGYTAWGWLYVQWLWVDESLRGQGMAGRMLEAAEHESVSRGCHGAFIDTFNPNAAKAYQRQGYRPFGTLPDFPVGRSRIFLQKKLTA